jgi:hypothetical protein
VTSRIQRGDLLVGPVGLALEVGEEPVEGVELPQVVPAPVEGVPGGRPAAWRRWAALVAAAGEEWPAASPVRPAAGLGP